VLAEMTILSLTSPLDSSLENFDELYYHSRGDVFSLPSPYFGSVGMDCIAAICTKRRTMISSVVAKGIYQEGLKTDM